MSPLHRELSRCERIRRDSAQVERYVGYIERALRWAYMLGRTDGQREVSGALRSALRMRQSPEKIEEWIAENDKLIRQLEEME